MRPTRLSWQSSDSWCSSGACCSAALGGVQLTHADMAKSVLLTRAQPAQSPGEPQCRVGSLAASVKAEEASVKGHSPASCTTAAWCVLRVPPLPSELSGS